MEDNILIEEIKFSEEMYEKAQKENKFEIDENHGIGDEENGNS